CLLNGAVGGCEVRRHWWHETAVVALTSCLLASGHLALGYGSDEYAVGSPQIAHTGIEPGLKNQLAAVQPSATWPQFRHDAAHTGSNPDEVNLTAANVAALKVNWVGSTSGYVAVQPAVADGVVYIGAGDGRLYAYKVGCASGGSSCTPLWTASTG